MNHHHTSSPDVLRLRTVGLLFYLLAAAACSSNDLTDNSEASPSQEDPSFRRRCQRCLALQVTPDSTSLAPQQSAQFAAMGIRSDSSTTSVTVTWSATGGSIDSAGNFIAGSDTGTYNVIASSSVGSLVDTARVVISNTASTLAAIVLTPSSVSLAPGGTQKFLATGKMSDGTTSSVPVSWTATGGTVDSTGLYQAGSTGGTYRIIVRQLNGTLADTAAITIASGTPSEPGVHAGWQVTPGGSSAGDGSAAKPWSLSYALSGAGGKIQPGDTVWLRSGTYTGTFRSSLTGTSSAPIVVRQYPGERAVIDAGGGTGGNSTFAVAGNWSVLWGFEVTNSDPNRLTSSTASDVRPNSVVNYASHTKYVNMVVHDGGTAFYTDPSMQDVEIYGSIFYNNGWQGPDRGHGHALYLKSYGGQVVARDNILFTQYGYGVHGYTNAGSGGLNNIHLESNIAFNNGTVASNSSSANILLGGGEPVSGSTIVGNMTYFSPGVGGSNVTAGYSGVLGAGALVENNYAAGGTLVFDIKSWQSLTVRRNRLFGAAHMVDLEGNSSGFSWDGNTYSRDPSAQAWYKGSSGYTFSGWRSATGLGASDQTPVIPTQPAVFVRPNVYEKGRATVVVYNWSRQGAVLADLSGVLQVGDRYEVRNVQDLFGSPIVSGSYGGGTISLPMNGVAPRKPLGGSITPPKTGPDFDVFVVSKVGS